MCIVSKNNAEYLQKDLDICKNHCLNFFKANFCILSCKIIAIHFLTQLPYFLHNCHIFCLKASCQKCMHDDFIFPIMWEVQMSCCCNCILMYQFIMSICSLQLATQESHRFAKQYRETIKCMGNYVSNLTTSTTQLYTVHMYICTYTFIIITVTFVGQKMSISLKDFHQYV